MKVKIEGIGYIEAPDDSTPEQISAAVRKIGAKHSSPRKKFENVAEGIGIGTAKMLGGMGAASVGGLAGLARLITTGDIGEAQKTLEGITGAIEKRIIPEPTSETSQKISDLPGKILEYYNMPGHAVGEKIEKSGHPMAAATAESIWQSLPILIPAAKAIKKMGKKPVPKPEPAVIPPETKPPKVNVTKATGPALDAETLDILESLSPGKRKMPEIKQGLKPKEYEHVIGIDMDNVLNRIANTGKAELEPDLVANLNKILDADPKAKLLVGSTWRLGHTTTSFEELLTNSGVRPNRVIGLTGSLENSVRGAEYAEWLKSHGKKVKKFITIDDLPPEELAPLSGRQIRTEQGIGLTSEHADTAINLLKGKQKSWQWDAEIEAKRVKIEQPLPVGPGARTAGSIETPVDIEQLRTTLSSLPRTPASERFKTAIDIAGKGREYKNTLDAGLDNIKAGAAGLWDAYTRPPVDAKFKNIFGDYLYERLLFQDAGVKYAKDIKKTIPNILDREAMKKYLEAGGDEAVLRERITALEGAGHTDVIPMYKKALELTPEQKIFAQNNRNYFDSMLEKNIEAGILEDGVENYVKNIVVKGSMKSEQLARKIYSEMNAGLLKADPNYAKKRFYANSFEGEIRGVRYNNDLAYGVVAYDMSFKEALATRAFIKELTTGEATDGRPLATVSGRSIQLPRDAEVPEAYLIKPRIKPEDAWDYREPPNHPAFRKYKWVDKDIDGNPIFVEGHLLLHPEIEATFAERFTGKGYFKISNLFTPSAIAKNPIGRSAMKGMGEFKRTLLTLSGFHQVQVGTHAVFHNVNPFKVAPIDLVDPVTVRGVKNGLMITDHSALAEFSEGVGGHSGLVNRLPGIGPLMQKYQEYLFQDYIPRVKVTMFKEAYERNTRRYPNLNEDQIAELTAHQANAAFGELNYKWLGRNKTFQDSLRVLFLAPDFLEARVNFVAQSLTPTGKEQLAALIRGTAELYVGARIMNAMLNDGDFKMDKPFSVVYDKKEYALRTIPGDLAHLFSDPRGFTYFRLNPATTRPMVEWATGKDAQGRRRTPELEVFDFLKSGVPIPIQGFMKDSNDTLGESVMKSALQSIGINSYVERSNAEKIAAKASAGNIPLADETFETRAKRNLMRKLRDAVQEQPTGLPEQVRQAVVKGEITPRQAINLMQDRNKPAIQRSFEHLRLPQQLKEIEKVFDAATPQEKQILAPLMRKKVLNFFSTGAKADRDEYRERLLPYLKGEK